MYLETERMLVRDFRSGDADDFYEILGDEETMKFIEPVNTYDETVEFLKGFCMAEGKAFAAQYKADGKMIGYILFKPFEHEAVYEIGWIFNRKYWGQGLAGEACAAVVKHAFLDMGIHKIVANTTDPVKSAGLMEKLGMKREGHQREQLMDNDGHWVDYYLYGMLREDMPRGES